MHYYIYFFLLGLVVGISSTRAVGILLRERRNKAFPRPVPLPEKHRWAFSSSATSHAQAVGILMRERRNKAFSRPVHLPEKHRRAFSSAVTTNFLGWERLRGLDGVDHFTNSYLGATDAGCYVSDYEPGQLSSQPDDMP